MKLSSPSSIRCHLLAVALILRAGILPMLHAADDGLFFRNGSPSRWSRPGGPSLAAQPDMHLGATGIEFPLSFQGEDSRLYWDTPLDLDLSAYDVFSFLIQVDDPLALSRATLYFRSGDGWYGGWFRLQGDNWQTINLTKRDFGTEGQPVGWNQITGARLAFWGNARKDTRIRLAGFQADRASVFLLRNTDARRTAPQEFAFAERQVERIQNWLRSFGIGSNIITDDDLRQKALPENTKVLILPFNPVITNGVPEALKAFTDQGGKLIVAYSLSKELAPLLGLEGWRWMRAEPADAFTYMQFDRKTAGRHFPEKLRQDSWNINRPIPATASVLATWTNAQGEDSGIPAITIGTNGVFLGHILTNVDRERKSQMLLSLIAEMVPSLHPDLIQATISRSATLFTNPDWNATRKMILDTAQEHRRHATIGRRLRTIDHKVREWQERDRKTSYADTLLAAEALKDEIRSIYYQALSPRFAHKNEFRAVWAHQAAGIRGRPWQDTVKQLEMAAIGHVFVNLLWGGAAFYPSEVLPNVAAGRDYAQEALDACRKHGLKLHAWMVFWHLQHAPESFISEMRAAGRLIQDRNGKEHLWLCPTHPENRRLSVRAALEIIERYDLDGFHLDYIRYPDANTCFCQGCATRFRGTTERKAADWPAAVVSGPDRQAYLDWRREQISSLVATLHSSIRRVNPKIAISAAVWPGWPSVRDSIGQDWPSWGHNGWVDFFLPMSYVTSPEEALQFYTRHKEALRGSVPFYPGIAPSTDHLAPEDVLRQIDALRKAGATGFALFDLDTDLLERLLPAFKAGAGRP